MDQRSPRESAPAADLLLLTWAAGAMDALSYIRAGVFTANMTGNTVVLGLSIVGPERARLIPCLVSISAFGAGALIAALLLVRSGRPANWARDLKFGIGLELPFVFAFELLSLSTGVSSKISEPLLIVTAACALGIQSVAVRRLKISGVVTTFITGTITTAILSMVERADHVDREGARVQPFLLACVFAVYVLAAVVVAILAPSLRAVAAAIPAAVLLAVFLRSVAHSSDA